MNSAGDLSGILIILDVTALAFAQIIYMRETGPWETDYWIVISSEEATVQVSLFCFRSCFESVHTRRSCDMV